MSEKDSRRLHIYILNQQPLRIEIYFPDKKTAENYREKVKSKRDGISPPPVSADPMVAFDLPDSVAYITWSESGQQFIVYFKESKDVASWVDDTICVRLEDSDHRAVIKQYLPVPEQESKVGQAKEQVGSEDGKRERRDGDNTRHPEGNAGPPAPAPGVKRENWPLLVGPARPFKPSRELATWAAGGDAGPSNQSTGASDREGKGLEGNARSSKVKKHSFGRGQKKTTEHLDRAGSPIQGKAERSERAGDPRQRGVHQRRE
jgi:hypothetical protein